MRAPLIALAAALLAGPSLAQALQPSPPPQGGGPTGNDIIEGPVVPRIPRGVIQPPMQVDPGIQAPVPEPRPGTMPVIPPPNSPGGDPRVIPR